MDRDRAAEVFAEVLLREGVEKSIMAFFNSLGRPMGKHKDQWERLGQQYANANDASKELFRFAIKEATILAIFGLATHLDGDTGSVPIEDRAGRLAVSLKVYRTWEDSWKQPPEEVVEICPTMQGEDIHDVFLSLVDEWEAKQRLG